MNPLTINAKYKQGKLIPIDPLPKDVDCDALIILMQSDRTLDQKGLLNIEPLSLGGAKTKLSRDDIYNG